MENYFTPSSKIFVLSKYLPYFGLFYIIVHATLRVGSLATFQVSTYRFKTWVWSYVADRACDVTKIAVIEIKNECKMADAPVYSGSIFQVQSKQDMKNLQRKII